MFLFVSFLLLEKCSCKMFSISYQNLSQISRKESLVIKMFYLNKFQSNKILLINDNRIKFFNTK